MYRWHVAINVFFAESLATWDVKLSQICIYSVPVFRLCIGPHFIVSSSVHISNHSYFCMFSGSASWGFFETASAYNGSQVLALADLMHLLRGIRRK